MTWNKLRLNTFILAVMALVLAGGTLATVTSSDFITCVDGANSTTSLMDDYSTNNQDAGVAQASVVSTNLPPNTNYTNVLRFTGVSGQWAVFNATPSDNKSFNPYGNSKTYVWYGYINSSSVRYNILYQKADNNGGSNPAVQFWKGGCTTATNNGFCLDGNGNQSENTTESTFNRYFLMFVDYNYTSGTARSYIDGNTSAVNYLGTISSDPRMALYLMNTVQNASVSRMKGDLAMFAVINRSLTATERSDIYNSGNVVSCGAWFGTSSPATTYFDLTATNGSALTNFNATINGTAYTTTNGTISTLINQSLGVLVNITATAYQHYSNTSSNINSSTDYQITLYRTLTINATDGASGAAITSFSAIVNGQTYTTTIGRIRINDTTNTTFNVTISATFYYSNSTTNYAVDTNSNRTLQLSLNPQPSFFITALDQNSDFIRSFSVSIYNSTNYIGLYNSTANFTYNNATTSGGLCGSGCAWTDARTFLFNDSLVSPSGRNATNNSLYSTIGGSETGTGQSSLRLKVTYTNGTTIYTNNVTYTTSIASAYMYGIDYTAPIYSIIVQASATAGSTTQECDTGSFCIFNFYQTSNIRYFGDLNNYTLFTNTTGYSYVGYNYSFTTDKDVKVLVFYPNPSSINITILSEDNLTLLSGTNVTIITTNITSSFTNYTTTGGLYIASLSNDNYTLSFSASGFPVRQYRVTFGSEFETVFLTAYMTPNATSNTIIVVEDALTSTALENCIVAVQRSFSGTYTTIQSGATDVTGASSFNYVPDQAYRFIISCSGYESKVFVLNPIIFSSYTVRMTRTTGSYVTTQDFGGVAIVFSPKAFYDGDNNFSIVFTSFEGTFTNYGFNLTYPGGSTNGYGINAYGESISTNFTIINPSFWDVVNITVFYDTTLTSVKSFNYTYPIDEIAAAPGTFIRNQAEKYGLGDFEAAFVVTVIILLVAGVASWYAGSIAGGTAIVFLIGYFTYIGMIPFWASILAMLAGFVVITWRSSS